MPQLPDMTTNPLLTRFVIAYAMNREGLVADRIAPKITGVPDNGTYYKRDTRTHFRTVPSHELRRPKGGSYAEIDYDLSKATYETEDKGLRAPIDVKEVRRAESNGTILDLRQSKARVVTDMVLLSVEKEVADLLTNTSNLTQNTTLTAAAGTQWDDYDNSDPIDTIETGIKTIRGSVGLRPNMLVLPFEVFLAASRHPVLLARNGRDDVRDLGEADLAKLFKVDEVVVADAIYDSEEETTTDVMTGVDVWGKDAILAYVEPDPDREARSLAYQLVAQDLMPANYESVDGKTEWAEVGFDQVLKLIDPLCGYLIKSAIS